eukprot:11312908-Alexandrium_andersonii.AAC.1
MLDVLVNVSYGLETCAEFGLPAKLPAYRPCDEPSSGDRRAAEAAARNAAVPARPTHRLPAYTPNRHNGNNN